MNPTVKTISGTRVKLSSLDKPYYPDDGIVKKDVLDHYEKIADHILPHLEGRPLSLQRFPDGIENTGFYQKEAADFFPDFVERVEVELREDGDKTQEQVVCNSKATLVYLANQGTITPHTWLSRAPKLDYPDKLIFDLDPPGNDFDLVSFTARLFKDTLEGLGLPSFLMTTGSRGLHVAVPLQADEDFEIVRGFARQLAETLAGQHSDKLTTELRKNKRKGRLFLDYLRNAYGQTSVPPYALRPKPGAPVATPLDWGELSNKDLDSQSYTISNIFKRLGQKEDPWKDFFKQPVSLKSARQQLDKLTPMISKTG